MTPEPPGGRAGRWRRWRLVAVASLLALGAATPGSAAAQSGRLPSFLPWTEPATPPLVLFDLAGARHDLADRRGRVVLLNFWATWCEPCLAEMASMARLRARLGPAPLDVLAVNYGESAERVRDFAARAAVGFDFLLDPGQRVARSWRVRLLPASFLVDPDGRVRHAVVGELDWDTDEVVGAIRSLQP